MMVPSKEKSTIQAEVVEAPLSIATGLLQPSLNQKAD